MPLPRFSRFACAANGNRVHGAPVGVLPDEIAYSIDCLREDRPIDLPSLDDVLTTLEVADAMIRSADEGRPVRL